eukprot:scaffold156645_cov51-Attheya_sp.AAC.1
MQKRDGTESNKPPVSPKKGNHLNLTLTSLPEEETKSDEEDEDNIISSDDDAGRRAEYDYKGREVAYSQVFGVTELYKMLSLLLESSLVSAEASKETVKALVPKHDSKLTAELCTLCHTMSHPRSARIRNSTCCAYWIKAEQEGVFCVARQQAKCLQPSFSSSKPPRSIVSRKELKIIK